ncbi:MAG: restriction endonuclease subunit S [Planctomycetes bacterium]|nr:restriction endonuclease subunit S [Planctomycetota bacterium]
MKVVSRWPTAPLGDVVEETQYGTSLKANEQGEGVPVLRMNNITYSGALDLSDMKHVEMPGEDFDQYSVRRGDLLFNRTNSQELVGKMGVWNRDEKVAFAGYLIRLRLKPDRADPAFVGAWFNTPEMKSLLRTRAKPSINMSNINATEVLKFPLVLPPLAEQRRIAEVLDRAEALRAKRRAALAQLDALTQSIFLDMFGDPATNPKRWPLVRLGEQATKIGSGSTPTGGETAYRAKGISLIRSLNVRDGEFTFKDLAHIGDEQAAKLAGVIVEANDVLLNITGASVARVCRAPSSVLPARVNQHVCIIRPKPTINAVFLEQFLLAEQTKRRLLKIGGAGATREAITKSQIEVFEAICPPIPLQCEFARRVTAVEALKTAQRASLAELDALFASLQHRAFRGEL